MTYEEAISYLDSRINYEKLLGRTYTIQDFKLERVAEFHRRLGSPSAEFSVIHVTGTKGKGSTSAMIARMLEESGKKVGLFQSPHFSYLGERFQVNHVPCSREEITKLVEEVIPVLEQIDVDEKEGRTRWGHATWFEIITMMGLLHFRHHEVDFAVLEVGMGGRLDATNICRPMISVITSISYDHMQQLGGTLSEIAYEKSGIIKPAVPVVCGAKEEKAFLKKIAEIRAADFYCLEEDFFVKNYCLEENRFLFESFTPEFTQEDYHMGMWGRHQADNAAVALEVMMILRKKYKLSLSSEALHAGIERARLPGRLEHLAEPKNVILDVAHNSASVDATIQFLHEKYPEMKKHFIFAVSADKEWPPLLEKICQEADSLILTEYLMNMRSEKADALYDYCRNLENSVKIEKCATPAQALKMGMDIKKSDDLLIILGSFFLIREIQDILADKKV
ncbi:MAG: folylpolyglutamate synthase/dihydrofolate synthase family protein [Planctomycetia bacterium]|nr:folylpolyglutamate synthase/dihydrofolate synthase family protein [Planctomycetia bacterium]